MSHLKSVEQDNPYQILGRVELTRRNNSKYYTHNQFLYREGLAIEHPIEDKITPQEEVKVFLGRAYVKRQALADRVARIVSQQPSEPSD